MIRSNQKMLNLINKIIDMFVLLLAMVLSYYIRFFTLVKGSYITIKLEEYMLFFTFMMPVYFLIYSYNGLYKPKRKDTFFDEFVAIIRSNIVGFFIVIGILYIRKELDYSRGVLVIFLFSNIFLMTIERGLLRYVLRFLRSRGYNQKHVVIIGTGDLARTFAQKLEENPQLGYSIRGFIDDNNKGIIYKDKKVIGGLSSLSKMIEDDMVDEIFVAIPLKEYDLLAEIIEVCEKGGVKAQIIPDYQKYLPAKGSVDNLDGIPLINIRYIPLEEARNIFLKRSFDIVGSIVALILSSPILLVCAIIIKTTSKGPVIFKQDRVGLDRKIFTMYKLRSMKQQADGDEEKMWTKKDDPRRTKFGEFMRQTSIDELPQFYNVLKGDMSIIGPRPERPYFVEKFKEEIPKYMIKHHVRPGITGYAQVKGYRGDTSIKKRIECDIFYIENWSLWLDFKIIIMTIFNGFVNKNAY